MEAHYKILGHVLHIAQDVRMLVRILDMAVVEILLEVQAGEEHFSVGSLPLGFRRELNTIWQRTLRLNSEHA